MPSTPFVTTSLLAGDGDSDPHARRPSPRSGHAEALSLPSDGATSRSASPSWRQRTESETLPALDVGHQSGPLDAAGDSSGSRSHDRQRKDVLDHALEGCEPAGRPLRPRRRLEQQSQLVARRLSARGGGGSYPSVGDDRVLAAEPAAAGPGGGPETAMRAESWFIRCRAPSRVACGLGGLVSRRGMSRPRAHPERPSRPSQRAGERLMHVNDVVVAAVSSRRRAIGPSGRTRDSRRHRRTEADVRPRNQVSDPPPASSGWSGAGATMGRRVPGSQHANVISRARTAPPALQSACLRS